MKPDNEILIGRKKSKRTLTGIEGADQNVFPYSCSAWAERTCKDSWNKFVTKSEITPTLCGAGWGYFELLAFNLNVSLPVIQVTYVNKLIKV